MKMAIFLTRLLALMLYKKTIDFNNIEIEVIDPSHTVFNSIQQFQSRSTQTETKLIENNLNQTSQRRRERT